MKRTFKNIFFMTLLASMVVFAYSCKDDALNSSDMLVYVRMDVAGIPYSTVTVSRTPVAVVVSGRLKGAPISATRPLAADAQITFAVDPSLIDAYNTANGTAYLPMPAQAFTLKNNGMLTIKAGAAISADSMGIEVTDPSVLTDKVGYIMPVAIKSVVTSDKGLTVSENYKAIYAIAKVSITNVMAATSSTMAGTVVTHGAGWVAKYTTNGGTSYITQPLVIDGIYTNGNYYLTTVSANNFFVLDLGASTTLKGIKTYTYNYSAGNNMTPTGYEISTSDTDTGATTPWNFIGGCTNSIVGVYASPPNESPIFIQFYAPVTTRYLKIRHTGSFYSGYWGLRELEIVQ